ncbi:MAG: glycoside hydrolase family 108 protein [Bacteroidia bacterium]
MSGQSDFERALEFVLKWETVFAKGYWGDFAYAIAENDPDDPGGLTKFGLDARTHGSGVANLSLSQAAEIYRREYWERFKCERWGFPISAVIFDCSVNCGFRQATLWFQRVCGASVDGVWGPKTDERVLEYIDDVGAKETARQVLEHRRAFYLGLNKPKFTQGWLNRVDGLERLLA